jgi:hypothetical protein
VEDSATPAWLADLNIDQRVVDFIVDTWGRVMEMEAAQTEPGARIFHDILPDLIWSGQEKLGPTNRSALMRLLPSLVKRLLAGMKQLGLPEVEVQKALDQLMQAHTQVLSGNSEDASASGKNKVRTLQELREHLAAFGISQATTPPQDVEPSQIQAELAKRGVSLALDLQREQTPSFESDADWLAGLRIGACVERWSDGEYLTARLSWISKRKTLYMFYLEGKSAPVVYSENSLIKSFREGSVRLIEQAPIFERAVESLNDARTADPMDNPNLIEVPAA